MVCNISYGTATLACVVLSFTSLFLTFSACASPSWLWLYSDTASRISGLGVWCASYLMVNDGCITTIATEPCVAGALLYECNSYVAIKNHMDCSNATHGTSQSEAFPGTPGPTPVAALVEYDFCTASGEAKVPTRIVVLMVSTVASTFVALCCLVSACVGTLSLGYPMGPSRWGAVFSTIVTATAILELVVFLNWPYYKSLQDDARSKDTFVMALEPSARHPESVAYVYDWTTAFPVSTTPGSALELFRGSAYTATVWIVVLGIVNTSCFLLAMNDSRRSQKKRDRWRRAMLSKKKNY